MNRLLQSRAQRDRHSPAAHPPGLSNSIGAT